MTQPGTIGVRGGEARAASPQLAITLHLAHDGPAIARESVGPSDLVDAVSELWLEASLRNGDTATALDQMSVRLRPERADAGEACTGYVLESAGAQQHTVRRRFSVFSLEHVARRAADRLLGEGALQASDDYYYQITCDDAAGGGADRPLDVSLPGVQTRVLEPLAIELEPLLERARPVGPAAAIPGPYRVFYTVAALEAAERCARRGATHHPPVETGGMLVAFLCSCPVSGEFFAVVVEVLEAHDAEQAAYSLAFSARTWTRIRAVMEARQRNAATRGLRIVGQCHGHNFVPAEGAPPCVDCANRSQCTRTSVFVSNDDWNWNRAVFRRQPWQLCHVFGLNARHEHDQGLFGLRDGRLLERGYHVLDDFHPEDG